MTEEERREQRVGVRELRQNLSVYLRRVKGGETLAVTERGETVARLTPVPPPSLSPLERLVADGTARMPSTRVRDLPPPQKSTDRPLSEILREIRDEDER